MMNQFFTSNHSKEQIDVQRRAVLKYGIAGAVASMVPTILAGTSEASNSYAGWNIGFRHSRTGESFAGVYRVGNKYLPDAFERLSYVMRDFRTNEVFPMDPRVIDILSVIHRKLGANEPFETLSGYRSPKTNSMLRHETSGVASNSFHMYGQAVDIRMPGYSTDKIRKIAMSLKAGGVGYYPRSNFVHVDTGKVRAW